MGNVNPRPYGRQASSTSVTDLSARPHEDLEDDIAVSTNNANNNNAQSGNPSRTAGLYFGGPLFMGNNPRTGNSDTVNRELSFLTALGGRPPAPQVHQVVTVRCPVNLTKTSLQLIPVDESNKNLYRVQFLFDATEEGAVSILYGVTESIDDSSQIVFNPPTHNGSKPFERGLGQIYEQPASEYLDITKFTEDDLSINAEKSYYPVVIILSSNQPNDKLDSKVALQITYASLIHCADDTYVIKPMKQKIRYNGKSYIVHDIYGLESVDTDGGRECVICMTEPRDTTVLPCRHMCLCNSCAEVLRHQSNKCPICRSTVKSMIEIKINKHVEEKENAHDSEDEEPVLVKKSKQHRITEEEDDAIPSVKTETSQDEM